MKKIMIAVMSVLLLAYSSRDFSMNKPKNELSYPSFLEAVEKGQVTRSYL